MDVLPTCRACRSPAVLGMHYCASCLLTPAYQPSAAPVTPSISLQAGSKIDRFQIIEILGVGGFSEVYSVCDTQSLSRPPLAMKVMRMGLNSAEFLARFEQEHHVLHRLEDPGIVRVFESGICSDGRPYFVMELVDGLQITNYCQLERLSLESRVQLFVDVCRTVHHAHQKGIIHRDLKPANILVSECDGKSTPFVIDFGLAKAIQSWNSPGVRGPADAWVTQLGVAMGTPGYISPEQADGGDDIDVLSDVFSLGVVLYELICQVAPWPHDVWKQLPPSKWSSFKSENRPPLASSHNAIYSSGRRIDRDLDTICAKALATDRQQRYESVSQLATDLSHWLQGDVISARPPSLGYRVSKLMSRYRWQSATLVVSLVAGLLTMLLGVTLALRERRYSAKLLSERTAAIDAKLLANQLREVAIEERTAAEQAAYASGINLATLQIASGQPYLAEKILNSTQASLRGWEWNYLRSLVPMPVASIATGLDAPKSLGISPNHEFAVVCDGSSISRINLKLKALVAQPCKIGPRVQHVAISDDGQYVATLAHQSSSSSIKVYCFDQSVNSEPANRPTLEQSAVWTKQVHADSSLVFQAIAGTNILIVAEGNGAEPMKGSAHVFNAATGQLLSTVDLKRWKLADKGLLVGKKVAVVRCSFDRLAVLRLPDLTIAGYVYGQPNVIIEDFELNEEETKVVFAQSGAVYEAVWNQSGAESHTILPDEKLQPRFEVDKRFGGIHRLNRTRENRWMAITDTHCIVEGSEPVPLPTKNETCLISLLDGTYAAILSHGVLELRLETLDWQDLRFEGKPVGASREGRRAAIAPSSDYCLYQNWSRQNLYKNSLSLVTESALLETKENRQLEWSRLPVFHPDGTAIIAEPSIGRDQPGTTVGTCRWDSEQSHCQSLPIHSNPWSAAASPDGKKLYVGTMDGIVVCNWPDGSILRESKLAGGPFVVMPMADNSGVFAIGIDHCVHSLPIDGAPVSSRCLLEEGPGLIPAHSDYFVDEQVLAIADSSGIRLFHVGGDHHEIGRMPAGASITAVRFSPDGKRLAVATSNRKITVWDWKGKHRLIELGTRGTCSSLDFSRNGRFLVNTDFNPTLTIR